MQGAAVDHYAVLGVERTATAEEIKAAHRRLVKTAHPDVGGDVETYRAIQTAYEVLMDPERRASYDRGEPGPETVIHAAQLYVAEMTVAIFKVGDSKILTFNLIDGMKEMCETDQADADKKITEAKKKVVLMDKVKSKLSHNGERPDVIGTTINREINLLNVEIRKQEFRKSLLKLAHFIISDYGYTPDEAQELKRREPNAYFTFAGMDFGTFREW